jgi:hypothetical protein
MIQKLVPKDDREWSTRISDQIYLKMCSTDKKAVIYEGTDCEQIIGISALKFGRKFIGIEKDTETFEKAKARLESVSLETNTVRKNFHEVSQDD